MRKYLVILVLLLITIPGKAWDIFHDVTLEPHINFRTPRADTMPVDWWVGSKLHFTVDSTIWVRLSFSNERENAIHYESYRIWGSSEYVTMDRIYDSEKSINSYSAGFHIPFKNFRFGYAYMNTKNKNSNNFYFSYNKDNILRLETILFGGLSKLDGELRLPIIEKNRFTFLINATLLYVSNLKWSEWDYTSFDAYYKSIRPYLRYSAGITIQIKIK